MKRVHALLLATTLFQQSLPAQQASNQIINSQHISEQSNILKASLVLHNAEENMFWPVYEQYDAQLSSLKAKTIASLEGLITDESDETATSRVLALLEDERSEGNFRKEYFEKIVSSANGSVALQFLQGEALYDLLLKIKVYEQLHWSGLIWTPGIVTNENTRQTVYEFILGVSPKQKAAFRSLLADFDFHFSRVVGHQYAFFEHYIDSANGWTPFQCKKIGANFVEMQLDEIKVKKEYYIKFREGFSPSFAGRFIFLHEYFNMMSKLKVWSDYLSIPK